MKSDKTPLIQALVAALRHDFYQTSIIVGGTTLEIVDLDTPDDLGERADLITATLRDGRLVMFLEADLSGIITGNALK